MRTRHLQCIAARVQAGAASVMIVFMIFLLMAASLTTALNLGATTANDAVASANMLQALLAAESGIERATQRFTTGGIACASLAEAGTTQPVSWISGTSTVSTGSFIVSQSGSTDFDGVTALPSGQCKVRVVGSSANGRVTRTLEAVVRQGNSGTSSTGTGSATYSPGNTTFDHTVVTGTDLLLVSPAWGTTSGTPVSISGVSFNGVALKSTALQNTTVSPCPKAGNAPCVLSTQFWYLSNPPVGTYKVIVTTSQVPDSGFVGAAINLSGTDTTNPIESFSTSGNGSASTGIMSTIVPNVSAGSFVVDNLAAQNLGNICVGSDTSSCNTSNVPSRPLLWNTNANTTGAEGTSFGPTSAAGAVTMDWNWNKTTNPWALSAVSIRASSTSGSGSKVKQASGSTGGGAYSSGVYKWREVTVPSS